MKMKSIFLTVILFIITICLNAQCADIDRGNLMLIRDFYIGQSKIWDKNLSPKELDYKLDSLSKCYCTEKVRKEESEWLQDGHDYFTYDYGIDTVAISGLKIEKYTQKTNTYKVSYVLTITEPKIEQYDVAFLVTLIEENGHYLIDEITGINEDGE